MFWVLKLSESCSLERDFLVCSGVSVPIATFLLAMLSQVPVREFKPQF